LNPRRAPRRRPRAGRGGGHPRRRGAGQTAAGIYSTGESVFSLLNSRGVLARHTETMARFSITAMAADSSGWAKASACDRATLNRWSWL